MNSKLIYTCLIISIVLMLSGCQNNTNELTYRNTKNEIYGKTEGRGGFC